ncbi:MAG: 30S ribosomal protein S16 [Ignavibacteriales bacterium]|nr:30S ribosomal protein S16 [Ignavibacteriales bacterium]
MVKIRLRREGKKGHPIYKLVAADMRSPRNGRFIEALGQYNPHTNPITLTFKEQRVEYWLKKGAQPSDTVRSLLRRNGFWLRWTLVRQGKDESVIAKVLERWQMQTAERGKRETDRKARRSTKKKSAAPVAEVEQAAPAQASPPSV